MDVKITAKPDGVGEAARARLEQLLRSILDPCVSRTPLVIVRLEDLGVRERDLRWECRIYARLLPSGATAVVGNGEDAETALRGAAGYMARSLRREDSCCLISGQRASTR